jgi:hypothetical protein
MGILVGELMIALTVCDNQAGHMLVQILNIPSLFLCFTLRNTGIGPNTGFDSDLFEMMILAIPLQWAIIGLIVGVVRQFASKKRQ